MTAPGRVAAPPAWRPGFEASRAVGRMKTGELNKSEMAYQAHLEALRMAGEVFAFWFEPLKFRLADNTFYTPDFMVMRSDRTVEMHEVKGHWQDDARVKIKVAASRFPLFRFVAVKARAKRDGGGFSEEEF